MLTELLAHSNLLTQAKKIWVGFSGGIDSSVLLHVLINIPELASKIQVIHVNHQLQEAAVDFEKHCLDQCERWGVPLKVLFLNQKKLPGESLEAYARAGRYELFQSCLESGDILVTAHHQEDQVETFLIQLIRGAGVDGLSAMPTLSVLGQGYLYRPWLSISKQAIKNYAQQHELIWIDDPSNSEIKLERNFWRAEVLPKLTQRHPGLFKTMARSARNCAAASELLENFAEKLLEEINGERQKPLPLKLFKTKSINQQILILRYWLKSFDLILSEAQSEVLRTQERLQIGLTDIRVFQNHLYVIDQSLQKTGDSWEIFWDGQGVLKLPNWPEAITQKSLKAIGIPVGKLDWSCVSFRNRRKNIAEKVLFPGLTHHRSLKNLFQEKEIPPWLRDSVPLMCQKGQIIAIVFG